MSRNIFNDLPKMPIPLFDNGHVFLCTTKKQWQLAHEYLNSEVKFIDRGGCSNSFINKSNGLDIYLLGWFDRKTSTLAHEAAHIALDICYTVGVDVIAGKANETLCYLIDNIVSFAEGINGRYQESA